MADAGGACQICGYSRSIAALEFHHLDPSAKSFSVAERGLTRSLERARQEANKCLLVCSNCHAELEVGWRSLEIAGAHADNQAEHIPG